MHLFRSRLIDYLKHEDWFKMVEAKGMSTDVTEMTHQLVAIEKERSDIRGQLRARDLTDEAKQSLLAYLKTL